MAHMEEVETVEQNGDAIRGAAIVEDERKLGLLASARLHWKILLICLSSFTAGMLFGYDIVVNGASISMPAFLIYYGDIGPTGPYLPSIWTSLWTAMTSLAQVVGGFVIGQITDRYGRKWPTVIAGAITVAGTAMQYCSTTRGVLLGGKILNGAGIGAAMATATAYASEVAPLNLRGPIQSCLVLFTVSMQAVALGVVRNFVPDIAESSFRTVFAIQWAVGGLLMVAFLFVPESPIYLINNGRVDQARKSLSILHGSLNSIDARLAYLVKTIREENLQKQTRRGTYIECFRGANLKRTLTVIFIFSAIGLSGGAFLAQSIYFLIIAGLPAINSFDIAIGGFGLAMIFIVISWFAIDKIGRRTMFLSGGALNALGMLIIGALAYAPGDGPLWAIAILMNFLISWQSVCLLATGWVIVAEISSYRLRAKTQAIGVIAYAFFTWFFAFTVPYIYNVDSGNLGAKTGFVFMGTSICLVIGSWFLIPNTAGMTTEEVDWMYTHRIPVRNFRAHLEEMRMQLSGRAKAEDA